ncbi:MAG: oxidoreductase [Filimonas sp.]|nr:oxidoreductase [Filimonas sp.]
MKSQIKVGLVGYGMAAKVMHAPFLHVSEDYEVTAVLERNRTESKALFPHAQIVRDLDALLQADCDLVVITTPNDTHFPYAQKALMAGKHVVVEKPFTITTDEARLLIATANQCKKVLSVYQNRRYVGDFLTMHSIISQGLLGDIHAFEGRYERYRPEPKPNAWREEPTAGSGILYDLGAHLIDQAQALFGMPVNVTADVRMQRPHARTDDYFDIQLDYGFNIVTLKASMLVREQGPRYMIQGTKGSFIKYGEDPQEALLKEGIMPVSEDWGKEEPENYGLLHTEMNGEIVRMKYPTLQGSFGYFYRDLYDTIANGAPPKVTPEQAYNTIKLIELAFESSREKRTIEVR